MQCGYRNHQTTKKSRQSLRIQRWCTGLRFEPLQGVSGYQLRLNRKWYEDERLSGVGGWGLKQHFLLSLWCFNKRILLGCQLKSAQEEIWTRLRLKFITSIGEIGHCKQCDLYNCSYSGGSRRECVCLWLRYSCNLYQGYLQSLLPFSATHPSSPILNPWNKTPK